MAQNTAIDTIHDDDLEDEALDELHGGMARFCPCPWGG